MQGKSRCQVQISFACIDVDIWMFPRIVVPPNHPFNRVFHYKPSILGYPYFWKHPYTGILLSISPSLCHTFTVQVWFEGCWSKCHVRDGRSICKICGILLVRLLVGVNRAWISITFFFPVKLLFCTPSWSWRLWMLPINLLWSIARSGRTNLYCTEIG